MSLQDIQRHIELRKSVREPEEALQKAKDAKQKVYDFFRNNTKIKDKDVHALSDKLGIDTHKFEGMIYDILSTMLSDGKGTKLTEKDVDAKQLAMGRKVELEHLDPKSKYAKLLATKISLDHLAEDKEYYTKLKKMEEGK